MQTFLILVVLLALPLAAITGLVDAARRPAHAFRSIGTSKTITLIGLLISWGVGGIYYWLVLRGRVRRAESEPPPPASSPGRTRRIRSYDPWDEDADPLW